MIAACWHTSDVTTSVKKQLASVDKPAVTIPIQVSSASLGVTDPFPQGRKQLTIVYGAYTPPGQWDYKTTVLFSPTARILEVVYSTGTPTNEKAYRYSLQLVCHFKNSATSAPYVPMYARFCNVNGTLVWHSASAPGNNLFISAGG